MKDIRWVEVLGVVYEYNNKITENWNKFPLNMKEFGALMGVYVPVISRLMGGREAVSISNIQIDAIDLNG